MAEIRTPQKQSYINKPIGVATARTGNAEAAQRIANAATSYASSISATVKSAFSLGANVQQNYEMQKYTNWAKTTPVLDENGKLTQVTMPLALSYRTKEQVNNILERRYVEANKMRTSEKFVELRQLAKNDPEEAKKLMSSYVLDNKNIIKNSGGLDYSEAYAAEATAMIGQHYFDMQTKKAAAQDQVASLNYINNKQREIDGLIQRVVNSGGNIDFTQEQYQNIRKELMSDIPFLNGMTQSAVQNLLNQIDKGIAFASLTSQLENQPSTASQEIVIALSTNNITDKAREIVPNIDSIFAYLTNFTNRDAVRADLETLEGNLSEREVSNRLLNTPVSGNGAPAQKYVAAVMANNFGITNEADFIEQLQTPETGAPVLEFMATQQAMPNWLISSLDSAANGTSMYSEQAIGMLAEAANQLTYTPTGRLISGGRGMDASTISFVKTLQALRTRYSDKNISDLVQIARSVRDDNPEYKHTINKILNAKSVDQSPTKTIKDYLYAEKNYNPEFVEKYSAVFGQHLSMNGTSDALDFLDTFYNSMYHDYEYSYKYDGGPDRQAYTPEFYFGSSTSPTGGSGSMIKFNGAVSNMVKSIDPNLSLGSDIFLDSDPRNNDQFGKFWAVRPDGSRMTDNNGNDVFITTKGINAMTNIERRNQIAAEEIRRAQAYEDAKTQAMIEMSDPARGKLRAMVPVL